MKWLHFKFKDMMMHFGMGQSNQQQVFGKANV